jgi:hypothetical protein
MALAAQLFLGLLLFCLRWLLSLDFLLPLQFGWLTLVVQFSLSTLLLGGKDGWRHRWRFLGPLTREDFSSESRQLLAHRLPRNRLNAVVRGHSEACWVHLSLCLDRGWCHVNHVHVC